MFYLFALPSLGSGFCLSCFIIVTKQPPHTLVISRQGGTYWLGCSVLCCNQEIPQYGSLNKIKVFFLYKIPNIGNPPWKSEIAIASSEQGFHLRVQVAASTLTISSASQPLERRKGTKGVYAHFCVHMAFTHMILARGSRAQYELWAVSS